MSPALLAVAVALMMIASPLLVVFGHPFYDVIAWPLAAYGILLSWVFFSVAGVWFGAWGVLAACFSMLMARVSAVILWPSSGWAAYLLDPISWIVPVLMALIPAWAFRYFKADPRVRTARDVFLFLLFGVIIANATSTLAAYSLWSYYSHWLSIESMAWRFIWDSFLTTIFGFLTLLMGSRIVIKAKAYCKGWFS